jgi:hypothetical protein
MCRQCVCAVLQHCKASLHLLISGRLLQLETCRTEPLDVEAASHLVAVSALACENFCQMNWENEHAVCCLEGLQKSLVMLRDAKDAAAQRWALHLAAAAFDRLEGLLTYESSRMFASLEPACAVLARELHVDSARAAVAMEDTVRAQPYAAASQVLAIALPAIHAALGMDPWRIVAPMPAAAEVLVGRLRQIASLADVQDEAFDEATVLIVDQVLLLAQCVTVTYIATAFTHRWRVVAPMLVGAAALFIRDRSWKRAANTSYRGIPTVPFEIIAVLYCRLGATRTYRGAAWRSSAGKASTSFATQPCEHAAPARSWPRAPMQSNSGPSQMSLMAAPCSCGWMLPTAHASCARSILGMLLLGVCSHRRPAASRSCAR